MSINYVSGNGRESSHLCVVPRAPFPSVLCGPELQGQEVRTSVQYSLSEGIISDVQALGVVPRSRWGRQSLVRPALRVRAKLVLCVERPLGRLPPAMADEGGLSQIG